MKTPFARVLRLAFRRRWALAGIALTSLAIALLWSANISALFPLVEVVFAGDTLPEYVETQITEADDAVVAIEAKIAAAELAQRKPDYWTLILAKQRNGLGPK